MNCPYCGEEMQAGFIQSRDNIVWTESECLIASLHIGGGKKVRLASGVFETPTVTAYLCEACKKVILNYSE